MNLSFEQYNSKMLRLLALMPQYKELSWDQLPTVSAMARRLKIRRDDVLSMIEDSDDLDLVVGAGLGYGLYEFPPSEYRIEWIGRN